MKVSFVSSPFSGSRLRHGRSEGYGGKGDWQRANREGVNILREYIRINTSNPPGNVMEAALFLQGILEGESVPCRIFAPHQGRANLLAVLKGNGSKKPLILLNRMDVVPVERDKWEMDPFGGVVRDGYIYGRGASPTSSPPRERPPSTAA